MPSSDLPEILVIDDEPDLPRVVENLLTGICTVMGFCTGEDALEVAPKQLFPVAIVDLQIKSPTIGSPMQGVEIMRHLRRISPFTQIIILTGHACRDSAISAVNAGAVAYIQKPFTRAILRDTVTRAFESYDGALLSNERLSLTGEHLQKVADLTPRMAEVAEGIMAGKTNEEIAKNLEITDRTVEKHVERLLAKFGISSRYLLPPKVMQILRQFRKNQTPHPAGKKD